MKTIWAIITILLVINALLLGGVTAWLYKSGRINQDRIGRIREMLSITITEEEKQKRMAADLEKKARQQAMDIARLESVSDGPTTLAERLETQQHGDELAAQRVERLKEDIKDLRRQLDLAKEMLAKQHAELTAERKVFEDAVARETKLKTDQDFQRSVQMYQQMKPKQAKQMFQTLLMDNKDQQVVDYLAAMQMRKAAAVLREFKTPQEIVQATDLLQRLRGRGIELATDDGPKAIPAARTGPGS